MVWLIIIIAVLVFLFIMYRRSKRWRPDTICMINGANGTGKSLLSVNRAMRDFRKSHNIWWRRQNIWLKVPFINNLMKIKPNEEEPLLYSNIPLYSDRKHNILFKYYVPLNDDIIYRRKRPRYHSVLLWDDCSIMATSMDYKDKELSNKMSFFIKMIRHELKGSNRNLFGSHCSLYINTQSKNDTHFSIDRFVNQVMYIMKSVNIPFFKIVWVRDLLLIDSVENNFKDDIKHDLSSRWLLIPKSTFNKYDSYSYEFLSHDLPILDNENCKIKIVLENGKTMFEIATFHEWEEIKKSNEYLDNIIKGVVKNGQ